jgi:hypothetical protein
MFNGAVAGVAARTASAPIDLLKIRFQLQQQQQKNLRQYRSIPIAIRTILKQEGPLVDNHESLIITERDFGREMFQEYICTQPIALWSLELMKSFVRYYQIPTLLDVDLREPPLHLLELQLAIHLT